MSGAHRFVLRGLITIAAMFATLAAAFTAGLLAAGRHIVTVPDGQ